MENQLATLGILLAAIIVPISTIAMLKVHNANKWHVRNTILVDTIAGHGSRDISTSSWSNREALRLHCQ